jgi:predicted SAM-dependent methyltransferase
MVGEDLEIYRQIHGDDAVDNRRFHNIGAGSFHHPAWTNVDSSSEWYAGHQAGRIGIEWNLFDLVPLPVESSTSEIVYTSHTVEHVTDEAAQHLLCEAHRVLAPGGILRVTTPDMDLECDAFLRGDRLFFTAFHPYDTPAEMERVKINTPISQTSLQQIFLHHFASSVSAIHVEGIPNPASDEEVDRVFAQMSRRDAFNHFTHKCPVEIQRRFPGNHINWWNWEKMSEFLSRAGFSDIWLSGYGKSHSPVLRNTRYFDNTHPAISLYVEARKSALEDRSSHGGRQRVKDIVS